MIFKKILFLGTLLGLLMSCNKQKDFVCYLQEIDTYMTISKRSNNLCYIVFSNIAGVSSPSDTVDYIKTKNNDILFIVYDSINNKDIHIQSNFTIIYNSIKFNIKVYDIDKWVIFDDTFREKRDGSEYRKIKKEYNYVNIGLLNFKVSKDGIIIKEGDIFGGWK